ncbi:MAG: AEC family transporter [Clostridia bacterium]|nr:AEC family transporter [Clostridia bacterium]
MDTILILIRQIAQMFLLAGMGYLLFKGKKITLEGSRALGNILIYLALPAVIINGFLVERTPERLTGMVYSALGAVVLLLLSILIARLLFRQDAIAAFAGAFSNPGFFGIPLIVASLDQGAVFYVACFIAFLNIGQWTYGVSILTGQPISQGFQLKKLIRAPFIIAILIGLLLFFTQIKLPSVLSGCLSTVAGINTPLSMFTVGVYLAQTNVLGMFRKKRIYQVACTRLVLIPLLSLLLLTLIPESWHDMKLALLLATACPVGANVAVYAQLHGKDYPYAVETVVLSTLFSLLTIPAIVWLSSLLWR